MPSNEIGENRKGLCQVNTAGGVELLIGAFPGRFSLVLQHDAERCHVKNHFVVSLRPFFF